MQLAIDPVVAEERSRLAANRILGFVLRLMGMWRERCRNYPEIMVLIAVVVITSDRLTRTDDPALKNIANAVPSALLGRCNLASIAAATGLNRETVRRTVATLIDRGWLVKVSGLIQFAPGYIQQADPRALNLQQIEEFARTANIMLAEGVLVGR